MRTFAETFDFFEDKFSMSLSDEDLKDILIFFKTTLTEEERELVEELRREVKILKKKGYPEFRRAKYLSIIDKLTGEKE